LKGQINTEISLITSDLKTVGARNRIIFQIYPVREEDVIIRENGELESKTKGSLTDLIDTNSQLRSQTFVGPFALGQDDGGKPLRLYDSSEITQYLKNNFNGTESKQISFDQIIRKGQDMKRTKIAQESDLRKPEVYAQVSNLIYLNSQTATQAGLNSENLKSFIDKNNLSKNFAKDLCDLWPRLVLKNELSISAREFSIVCHSAIAQSTRQFFQWDETFLIQKVKSHRLIQNGLKRNLNLNGSFSMSTGLSQTLSRGGHAGVAIEAKARFLKFIGVGAELSYGINWATGTNRTESNSISFTENSTLDVRESQFEIISDSFQKCMTIKIDPKNFITATSIWKFLKSNLMDKMKRQLSADQKILAARRGIYICSQPTQGKSMKFLESYYLISQDTGSNEMQDSFDERNRSFYLVLRGRNDYSRLSGVVKSKFEMPAGASAEESMNEFYFSQFENLFKSSMSIPGYYLYSH